MAGLFGKQADIYVDIRPTYLSYLFSMLASLTPHHSSAWDAGTGINGQAAIGVSPLFSSLSLSLSLTYIIRSLINLSQSQLSKNLKKKKKKSKVSSYPTFLSIW